MDTLSLVETVELEFQGNVLKNSIYLGDADNDGLCELIVGNSEGEMAIFRNDKCIGGANNLGTISAITVGDLLNIGRNVVVVVTIEGWVHVFDIEREFQTNERIEIQPDIPPMFQLNPADKRLDLIPFHSQRIPPNSKTLHLGDVNGDGKIEMIVGLTDRVLRTYIWRLDDDTTDKPKNDREPTTDEDTISDGNNDIYDGRLYGMNKWEFANQIGALSLQKCEDFISILVSQPGGTVTQITERVPGGENKLFTNLNESPGRNDESPSDNSSSKSQLPKIKHHSPSENILMQYHSLDVEKMRNRHIATEVSGNIIFEETDDHYGVATIDGTIMIAKGNEVKWSYDTNHQILTLAQVNGKLLACSCEGDTYLIQNQKTSKMPVKFQFEESVAAFSAGLYAIRNEEIEVPENEEDSKSNLINKNCMVYVTFHEKIYIYQNDML